MDCSHIIHDKFVCFSTKTLHEVKLFLFLLKFAKNCFKVYDKSIISFISYQLNEILKINFSKNLIKDTLKDISTPSN